MTRSAIRVILLSTAVMAASLLYFLLPANRYAIYPECPFHWATGMYCPGCGSQRAFSALIHGHWLQALSFNVLFVAALPFIGYAALVSVWNAFSQKTLRLRFFYSSAFARTVLVLLLLFWVLRNIPVYPLNLLAP